jgi:teichoic acid transport system permease protein
MGTAAFMATLNVYFRDTGNFLPFLLRLWMYLSPVLWTPDDLDAMLSQTPFPRAGEVLVQLNPVFSMLTGYTDLLQNDTWPPTYMWLASAGWALASVVIGFLFFISRERDFAVRVL